MQIIRGYKVRIYPNKSQQQTLVQTIGACRWVYNHFLEEKKRHYLENKKSLSYGATSKQLTALRKETDWLSDIQFQPLQQSLRNLDVSYGRFFRKQARFPQFKSKKDTRQSFRKVTGWKINNNKISVMNGVEVKFRGTFPDQPKGTLTISKTPTGKWHASTIAAIEIKQPKQYRKPIGIDLGITDLAITNKGKKYPNIHIGNTKKEQQGFSRKQKGSNRRAKVKVVLARKYEKIANRRSNHLHCISKTITSKNHAAIVVEDLAVKNMMSNHKLARSIANASWGEFLRQLKYKQEWRGGKFIVINRFFPSSKTCSKCHFIMQILPLSIREWMCPRCETKHDRDINAAKMLLQQAGELLGVETGDGRYGLRSMPRVTRSMKRGYARR